MPKVFLKRVLEARKAAIDRAVAARKSRKTAPPPVVYELNALGRGREARSPNEPFEPSPRTAKSPPILMRATRFNNV